MDKTKQMPKYNIFCYNNWHFGDLIFLIPLYKKLIDSSLFKIKLGVYKDTAYLFEHLVCNNFTLVLSNDINEGIEPQDLQELCPPGYLTINTWLGQYQETISHTWKSTVLMFNRKMLAHNIPYILPYDPKNVPMVEFPKIDLAVNPKSIYIENGRTRSGHSMFIFDLELLTEVFPDCSFYCTAKPKIKAKNIIDCSDKNFIELANISNKCVAIIGKGSGPLLCTYTEKNRFKPRAVCGYDTKKWQKFWTYQNNPLIYLNSHKEIIDFISDALKEEPTRSINKMEKYAELDSEITEYLQDNTEMTCDYAQTSKISKDIANIVNKYVPKSEPNYDKIKLSELRLKGLVKLDNATLEPNKVFNIVNHFKQIPAFAGHVPAQSDKVRRFLNAGARKYPFGSYEIEDSLQCPHLLELALSPGVLSLVEGYLGCAPTIYSINTWWSFPGFLPVVSQDFHRDVDDFKFLALFVYLTDVEGGAHGGQHRFITHTQHEDQVEELLHGDTKLAKELFIPELKDNGYNQAQLYEKCFKDQIQDITGMAGSVFLADTYALHKGVPPMTNARLVCWIRYGLRKNLTYSNDETKPIPFSLIRNRIDENEKNKYMLRLITTEKNNYEPTYKIESNGIVQDIKLSNYNWKQTLKKYKLNKNNIITKIINKLTSKIKEPT